MKNTSYNYVHQFFNSEYCNTTSYYVYLIKKTLINKKIIYFNEFFEMGENTLFLFFF